jgi:hypothetical protein
VRQLAGVLGSIGLLVAAVVALVPISVEVPHGDDRCGPPLVRYAAQEQSDDRNEQRVIERCEDVAAERLVLAGLAVGVGFVAFLALRLAARRHDAVQRRRRRERRRRAAEEAQQEAERQARAEDAIARDAALRG